MVAAGTSKIDITPDLSSGPAFMTGYTSKLDMPAIGVHDPLCARTLVLDDGASKVAIVALDLIGLNPGRLPRMASDLGIDHLMLAASHTHGGPLTLDLCEPLTENRTWPEETPYLTLLEERVATSLETALKKLRPVHLTVGRGRAEISYNRRRVEADGSVTMTIGNHSRKYAGPTDPEVVVVTLRDDDGNLTAILYHYACHPVVLGRRNRLITADWPGHTCAYIERRFPGATALFLQGGCGDLDPHIDVQGDFSPTKQQGEDVGRATEDVLHQILGGDGASLDGDADLEWIDLRATFRRYFDPRAEKELEFPVLRIGDELALFALPGEPFVQHQLAFKDRAPVAHPLLVGYVNGYAGYFPTLRANREGGYGASWGQTMHVEAAAGETMVDMAVQALSGSAH